MPAAQTHRKLQDVLAFYQAAYTTPVGHIKVADSRGSQTRFRDLSSKLRCNDAPIRSLWLTAEDSSSPQMWKDGLSFFPQTPTDTAASTAAPGATLATTGIVNILPTPLYQIVATASSANAAAGRMIVNYLAFGGVMNSTATNTSTGGNARRGTPYAGGIQQIEVIRVTDSRAPTAWPAMYWELHESVNNAEGNNRGASAALPVPPSAASGQLLLTREVWTLTPTALTAGNGLTARYRFSGALTTGQATIVAGVRFVCAAVGVTYYTVAAAGWSTSDHLPNPVDGVTNADAKYTDEGIRHYLRAIATEKVLLIEFEVDQNNNQTGTPLEEWNGSTAGRSRDNKIAMVSRWRRILREPEFADRRVTYLINSMWYSIGDRARGVALRDASATAALLLDCSFYDQIAELENLGQISDGAGLASGTADTVHQNFAAVLLLGTTMWNAIAEQQVAGPLALGLGPAPHMPPSHWEAYTPDDNTFTPFVTTYVRADVGGVLPVLWADGTVEEIQDFPAQRAVPMRVKAILANNVSASGIQIGT